MLKNFEKEAIRILAQGTLDESVIKEITESNQASVEHTGAGYFLSVKSNSLPIERIVLNDPILQAISDKASAGLLAFIENSEFTLECHGWGDDEIPDDFRETNVVVKAT